MSESDLRVSLARLGGELVETRKEMAAAAAVASKHQRALVVWTAVLSVATIVYAVAALLPLFWHPFASSTAAERSWVLWQKTVEYGENKVTPPTAQSLLNAFSTRQGCVEAAQQEMKKIADRNREYGRLGAKVTVSTSVGSEGWTVQAEWGNNTVQTNVYSCLPDTVDPRGPKGR